MAARKSKSTRVKSLSKKSLSAKKARGVKGGIIAIRRDK